MGLSDTKRRILDAALELFSVYGYEATGIGQIADALGIKKPSLYSHFDGKQEIFDTLIDEMSAYYRRHSLFAGADRESPREEHIRFADLSPEAAAEKVCEQVKFLIHDEQISRVRKLMTIEQFRNPELSAMQEQRTYTDILNYHVSLMRRLMEQGVLREGDPEILALQYISPISMQLYRVDRDPACEQEAMELIRRHIVQFYQIYGRDEMK